MDRPCTDMHARQQKLMDVFNSEITLCSANKSFEKEQAAKCGEYDILERLSEMLSSVADNGYIKIKEMRQAVILYKVF